jgi:hypothetical protein
MVHMGISIFYPKRRRRFLLSFVTGRRRDDGRRTYCTIIERVMASQRFQRSNIVAANNNNNIISHGAAPIPPTSSRSNGNSNSGGNDNAIRSTSSMMSSSSLSSSPSSSSSFNPKLILSQILCLQCFHYVFLGLIFQVNHVLFATTITIDRIFTDDYLDVRSAMGWVDNSAVLTSSLVGLSSYALFFIYSFFSCLRSPPSPSAFSPAKSRIYPIEELMYQRY